MNSRQQVVGRLYVVGLVIAIYVYVAPTWVASHLYQICSRLFCRYLLSSTYTEESPR